MWPTYQCIEHNERMFDFYMCTCHEHNKHFMLVPNTRRAALHPVLSIIWDACDVNEKILVCISSSVMRILTLTSGDRSWHLRKTLMASVVYLSEMHQATGSPV